MRTISWMSWTDERSISRWRGSHRRKRPLAFLMVAALFAMRHKRRRTRSSMTLRIVLSRPCWAKVVVYCFGRK